jgi:hypothetical protein
VEQLVADNDAPSDKEKLRAIRVFICNENLQKFVRDVFQPELIGQENPAFAEIIQLVYWFFDKHDRLPIYEEICGIVERRRERHGDYLPLDVFEELFDVLKFVAEPSPRNARYATDATLQNMAVEIVKRWSMRLATLNLTTSLFHEIQGNNRNVDRVNTLVKAFETAKNRLDGLDSPLIDELFCDGLGVPLDVTYTPTGVSVIDKHVGGGMLGGEMLLFMGPFGSCKTTFAVMAACNMAKACQRIFNAQQGPFLEQPDGTQVQRCPVVFYVSTEATRNEFQQRCLTFLAEIPRERILESRGDLNFFSDSPVPTQPYEHEIEAQKRDALRQHNLNPDIFGCSTTYVSERQRIQTAIELLRKHLLFVEFMDSNAKFKQYGKNGVTDIQSIMDNHLRLNSATYVYSFVLDHVSALANRVCEKKDSHDNLHLVINTICRSLSEKIAKSYNIPVIVMHQLSGKANKMARNIATQIDHTDGSQSSSIGEFADIAVTTTRPVSREQIVKFAFTKVRRGAPVMQNPLVKVDGKFSRLIDYSDRLILDGDMVIPKRETRAVPPPTEVRHTSPAVTIQGAAG